MANEPNVAALKALLVELLEPGNLAAEEIGDLAEDLAARGVLVPSALTVEEARDAIQRGIDLEFSLHYQKRYPETTREPFVRELERIARGQA